MNIWRRLDIDRERKSKMKKIIEFDPDFDRRHQDPNQNYGINGVDIRFVLQGDIGAVQFTLSTNWHLLNVQKELDQRLDASFPHLSCHPMPSDLGYHSSIPTYEGETRLRKTKCRFIKGKKACYYDGSTLNAGPVYEVLLREGEKGVWRKLENYYEHIFGKLEPKNAKNSS